MIKISNKNNLKAKKRFSPAKVLIFGFLTIILTGGTLLLLPVSRFQSYTFSFDEIINSYFTAVSATCVTGLVACDTAATWSTFGRAVILIMIQLGGLGFMTMTVLFSLVARRRLSPSQNTLLAQSLNLSSMSGLSKLVKRLLIGTFITETLGACLLMIRFIPRFGVQNGIWFSFFHSISAFCNAGFDILGQHGGEYSSIAMFSSDPFVLMVLATLIFIGGIGFIVWDELIDFAKNKRTRLSVYTRFVLLITAVLLCAGSFMIFIGEFNNPETIGNMSLIDKMANSAFQSFTTRTAGFDAIGNGNMRDFTKIVCIMLMFIGGASGSTAGGIKVSTFGLLLYTVYCTAIGKTDIILFKRRISHANVFRALTIAVIGAVFTFLAATALQLGSGLDFIDCLYETVSAFATVGLSNIGTYNLASPLKIILMILMFFGRVGVLTITYALSARLNNEKHIVGYTEAPMLIG